MLECKRCGSTHTVKSGKVREKQRYLCKQCGYHFVEGDERENSEALFLKKLCELFQALGVKQHKIIGEYLKRDASLIHRWMNEKPIKSSGKWEDCVHVFSSMDSLFEEIKRDRVEDRAKLGRPILFVDNITDDLYISVIVQQRIKVRRK